MVDPFTEQPKIDMRVQTRKGNRKHTIRFEYFVRVMIMVGPHLPWLALGASHKPNSTNDSVQSHALTFCKVNSTKEGVQSRVSTLCKVNSTKESVQSRVSTLCNMLYSCPQKDKW